MSDTSKKKNVSGPKPRRTMASVRRQSQDEDAVAATPNGSLEANVNDSTLSFVSSASHSQHLLGEDTLDDSDGSISEDTDFGEVRSPTPIVPENIESFNNSRKTPFDNTNTSKPRSPRRPSVISEEHKSKHSAGMVPLICIILAVLAVVSAGIFGLWAQKGTTEKSPVSSAVLCDKFYELEQSYKDIDSILWDTLKTNVRRATAVGGRREPGTVMFLHNGSSIAQQRVNDFMSSIIQITCDCFGGIKPILLDGKFFARPDIQADYGVFQFQYHDALRQQKVLVVRNLEDLPAKAAPAFHSICDTEEPLVDSAVIYFEMDSSRIPGLMVPSGKSATADAELMLHKMWESTLKPEVLDPLIIRVTENVFRIV